MKNTFLKSIILAIVFFISIFAASAQEKQKVEILNADALKFDHTISSEYKRLIGNVLFKHNDILMWCDSAHMYNEQNMVKAFGKVHINQNDTLNIYCDSLVYFGNTKTGNMRSRVKMIDKQMTLTTNYMDFDFNTDVAYYYNKGKIVDPENVLTSTFGYYYSKIKLFAFRQNVLLVNKKYTMTSDTLKYHTVSKKSFFFGPTTIKSDSNLIFCKNGWYDTHKNVSQFNKEAFIVNKSQTLNGDSIYYNRQTGFGKAIGNIKIIDTTQKIVIHGQYAETYEKNDSSVVTGMPVLEKFFEKDTLYLRADTLKAVADSSKKNRTIFAYHRVKFYKPDFQGLCDSLTYTFSDSLIRMFEAPILWNDSNQLTAKNIEIKTGKNSIKQIFLTVNSFVVSQKDSASFNQIKGKNLTGYFVDNKLDRIFVEGNGETIYYAEEDDKSTFGINKANASNLLIMLKDNEVNEITFYKSPDAVLYPPKDLSKDEVLLKGFVWHKNKRPLSKDDIFNFVE
ncbi:MAG: OstA-like protein [Bacteroidota bacterium]